MEFNETFHSEILRHFDKLNLSQMRKISAVPKSLWSDLPEDENRFWDLSIRKDVRNNPDRLINLLLLVSKVRPEWYPCFIDFVANQCYKYSYQGKWRFLHQLAKLNYFNLIVYRIVETETPSSFFGNRMKEIIKFTENCPCRFLKQTKPKAKVVQRKRGYNDHGSRKLPHERHSFVTVSGKNPEREDHRTQYKKRSSLINFLYG